MHERNMLVAFPVKEIEQPYASLERLLVNMGKNRMPDYNHLSPSIRSTTTETCANWYYSLTSKDPELYERGDIAHVKIPTSKIIFSKNPTFGPDWCEFKASKRKDVYDSTLNIHSHKRNACFSGWAGDLGTLISGWDEGSNHTTLKASIVSCPNFNYLMFKTNETRKEKDRYKINNRVYGTHGYLSSAEFLEMGGFETIIGKRISLKKFKEVFKIAEEKFFANDFDTFYKLYMDAFYVAEFFRMGFYFSRKDGNYTRFTRQSLFDHITEQVGEALIKSKPKKNIS